MTLTPKEANAIINCVLDDVFKIIKKRNKAKADESFAQVKDMMTIAQHASDHSQEPKKKGGKKNKKRKLETVGEMVESVKSE